MDDTVSFDERVWEDPWRFNPTDAYWSTLTPQNVHLYFRESDFYDRMSKYEAIYNQYKPETFGVVDNPLWDRKTFENMVQESPEDGVEYITISEPQPIPGSVPPKTTDTYVIQKQERRKKTNGPDEVDILGHYFIIGYTIRQAPSLLDVISHKFLSTTLAVENFFKTAESLPIFTPARDYTYLQPSSTKTITAQTASQSRTSSPGPDSASQADSVTKGKSGKTPSNMAERSLVETWRAFTDFGGEYLDENPLKGEPGSFVFTSTTAHVQQQQQKQQEKTLNQSNLAKQAGEISANTAASTPRPVQDNQQGQQADKRSGKDGDKGRAASISVAPKKRKKSKALNSPTSPTEMSSGGASPS